METLTGNLYLLAADGNGLDSLGGLVDNPRLIIVEMTSYEAYDKTIAGLLPKLSKNDIVILDTISMMAGITRTDFKLGNDASISYWDKRAIYFGDKAFQTAYEAAGQLLMRRLKDCRARGANIIVTAHEKEKVDLFSNPPTNKRGPDVNDALMGALVGSSSDVLRLKVLHEDELTDTGKVKYKKGTRILELADSEDYISKTHVSLEYVTKLPPFISRPSMPKLRKALGKNPTFLVVYGPPGVGKTTLAVSDLLDLDGSGIGI